jgi:hypothetical protein
MSAEVKDRAKKLTSTVDLTAFFTVGRVNSGLGRRLRKDEPAAAGIDGAKAQNIAKERAVGLRAVAVEENMRACDARNHGQV